jgi:hypothetical protein
MTINNTTSAQNPVYYAMIIETLGGPEFTCKDENENPWIFLSEKAAWRDIVDSKITELNEFMKGNRELDDCIFQNDLYPLEVRIEGKYIIGNASGYILCHEIIDGTELSFEEEGPL